MPRDDDLEELDGLVDIYGKWKQMNHDLRRR